MRRLRAVPDPLTPLHRHPEPLKDNHRAHSGQVFEPKPGDETDILPCAWTSRCVRIAREV